jgi:chromosome segregation ATPase
MASECEYCGIEIPGGRGHDADDCDEIARLRTALSEAEAEIANNENELNVVHGVNKSLRTALDKAERRVEHACVTLDHYGAHEAAERYRKQTRWAQVERGKPQDGENNGD